MKKSRNYVAIDLLITHWSDIESYYNELLQRDILNNDSLLKWWKDRNELDAVLEEDLAWRYIKMNCDTENKALSDDFNIFVSEIEPEIAKATNELDKKLLSSHALNTIDQKKFFVPIRSLKRSVEIFREENVPIFAQLQQEEQEYGVISSRMTIHYEGKEHTMQHASNFLRSTDRSVRETVYRLMTHRRSLETEKLHTLFSKLAIKREQIAHNAGFNNYCDYKYTELGRFDYTLKDCLDFHNAIASEVSPIIEAMHKDRKNRLDLKVLKPWDMEVDENQLPPLQPFTNCNELMDGAIECFTRIRPSFGNYLNIMKEMGYLDLESRKGKAPGGFNYPLYESNIPFIYMNATGNLRDLVTLMHEGGHAVHSFLGKDLELLNFKSCPSEVAELASMSMELITMDHWNVFFHDEEELKRSKKTHLQDVLKILPWVATVDKFQHWLYWNPNHSVEERTMAWISISKEFGSNVIDWTGFEDCYATSWQKQLHIFEVPFYYIEYAISQLGAIAVWRNYKNNPEEALNKFEKALCLGYSVSIPEIYETAGIKFDFSTTYIKELMIFVREQLKLFT